MKKKSIEDVILTGKAKEKETEESSPLIRIIKEHKVDGIISFRSLISKEEKNLLTDTNTPIVYFFSTEIEDKDSLAFELDFHDVGYKEGEFYNINGLSIVVNNTYYSQYDYNGEVVSNKNNFVIVDLTVTNLDAPQTLNLNYFHLKNGTADYVTTNNLYSTEFQDLGVTYKDVKELKREESISFIIIYKVDKKLNPNNFVLYYQETHNKNILRKYKLKVKNLDKNIEEKSYSTGESLPINIFGIKDEIIFDHYFLNNEFTYRTFKCGRQKCDTVENNMVAPEGYNIIKIPFASTTVESKNMIDFVSKYGIIIYKDRDGYDREIEFESPISNRYYGKVLYLLIPDDFDEEKDFSIEFNVRGNKYLYNFT